MGTLASADVQVSISKIQIHVMRCNNGPTVSFVEMISIRYLDLVFVEGKFAQSTIFSLKLSLSFFFFSERP